MDTADSILSHPLEELSQVWLEGSTHGGGWQDERVIWSSRDMPFLVTYSKARCPALQRAAQDEPARQCLGHCYSFLMCATSNPSWQPSWLSSLKPRWLGALLSKVLKLATNWLLEGKIEPVHNMWDVVWGAGTGAAGCVERQEGHPSVCTDQCPRAADLDACAGAKGRRAHGITRRQEVRSHFGCCLLLQEPPHGNIARGEMSTAGVQRCSQLTHRPLRKSSSPNIKNTGMLHAVPTSRRRQCMGRCGRAMHHWAQPMLLYPRGLPGRTLLGCTAF